MVGEPISFSPAVVHFSILTTSRQSEVAATLAQDQQTKSPQKRFGVSTLRHLE